MIAGFSGKVWLVRFGPSDGGLRFRQQLDVPVQAASMRIGVQDGLTGRMGTIEIPLPVKRLPGVEQSLTQRMPEIEPD